MSSCADPDRTYQHATAADQARVNQVGGNQYNQTVVYGMGSGPAPQALDALPAVVPLVGREGRVGELLDVLDPSGPGPGVVVATGLAGVGKTALALHTAHRAVEQGWFGGGVLFVHLRGYDPAGPVSGEQALEALLRALGIREDDLPPTPGEQESLYRSELARRAQVGQVLIVADDASSTTQLLPLLPASGGHRLLATSRDALTAPDFPARLSPLDQLDTEPAAALIADALTRARPDDPRPRCEPEALREVAGYCGGLPLALTIVAAQATADPGLPLTTLAADLADTRSRLKALHYEDRDGRSLGVQAAFDLSYRRLDEQSARLFRLLSLAPGPDLATDTAAALTDQEARSARQSLAALARAGLLNEQPLGSDRWRMHDLTRLYANDQCQRHDTEPTRQQALARLYAHYRDTTEAADDCLYALPGQRAPDRFPDRTAALAWLEAERPNLTATVTHTATTGHPETTICLAFCLVHYLDRFRYFHDALTTAQHALTATRELGDRHLEGTALNNLGVAHQKVRRFDDAIKVHTTAAGIYRDIDDTHSEGGALNNLGNALQEVRRFEDAIGAHTAAAGIYCDLEDRHREGGALTNLGLALREVGRFEEAITAHTTAVAIFRDLNDPHNQGKALTNLGLAFQEARRFEDAIGAHTQDLAICRDLGDRHGEGGALNNLGLALREVGRFEEAITAHSTAVAIFRDLGDRHGEGGALNNLGLAFQEARRFEDAIGAHTQDLAICRDLGDRHGEGGALNNLGLALREVGRFEEAITAHSTAVAIFRDLNDPHGEDRALTNLKNVQNERQRRLRGLRALWRMLT
ncbi:tetratricopeptide repeat protein [Streptomyces sp. 549]|uniref:ATP-binding protein n=1 Tax=Streptomyces sp. 549 TaxID=3049076 RepID=UPI0024C40888|nr:tetratricopeptide repeat protein [Streptomyces sp. 549]MDK1476844.1 tetratricopeptide repeat protein [Streptomyces sp. 549]